MIYKEMKKQYLIEPAALFMVINEMVDYGGKQCFKGEIILLYPDEILELAPEKVYTQKEDIILEKQGEIRKIMPGDIFDFAGGSLQLVRWNNARQLINQYRVGTKSQ